MPSHATAAAPTTGLPWSFRSRALKVVHEPIDTVLDGGEDHVSGQGIAHNTWQIL
jgi:hypothetical protein